MPKLSRGWLPACVSRVSSRDPKSPMCLISMGGGGGCSIHNPCVKGSRRERRCAAVYSLRTAVASFCQQRRNGRAGGHDEEVCDGVRSGGACRVRGERRPGEHPR